MDTTSSFICVHPCPSVARSFISSRLFSFVILTVFFFARREDCLSRGFGHTRNGKTSIPKRVKPQRARRAQRLQRKNSRRKPVNVSPFSLCDLCALCGKPFSSRSVSICNISVSFFGSGRR